MYKYLFLVLSFFACIPPNSLDLYQTVKREEKIKSLLSKGNIYLARNEIELAEASFLLARELKNKDPRIFDALGCISFRKDNFIEAKYYFQQAIALDSKFDRAYAHLAQVAEIEGSLNAAAELYHMALDLNPLNYQAQKNYSQLVLKNKERFSENTVTEAEKAKLKNRILTDNSIFSVE